MALSSVSHERPPACRRAARPMRTRSRLLESIAAAQLASACQSPGGAMQPVSPSMTICEMPDALYAATGRPEDMASATVPPKPSVVDAVRNTSALAYASARASP
eukprot:CAMPEP_0185200600 /NCGR_PEP_ID=MMETSP1140-20130426/47630_1 /TAXON_ID=298111 /ORGANISM="Pavlova sp., Strain CCMP459" /LENGTH=103 /DNA_ID=CAMNT_0027767949 /DNA_START=108 /DNA_END=416 /DNA_ORIENTATION=+